MSQVREYETLYIVTPGLAEDEHKELIDAVAGIVKKSKGEIVKNDVWGKRKLSYTIKGRHEGIYVLLRYKAVAEVPAEIDTYVKRTPDLLRHLTTVVTKQQVNEEARLRSLEAKRAEDAKKAAEEAAKREAEREAKAAQEAEKAAAAAAAEAEAQAAAEKASESDEAPAPQETDGSAQAEAGKDDISVADVAEEVASEETKEAVNE
jgi:small subunit ribosomal protein S6